MLSDKQGDIKYHFLCLWYDSTWDWTQVSRAIGEHSNHHANIRIFNEVNNDSSASANFIFNGSLRKKHVFKV